MLIIFGDKCGVLLLKILTIQSHTLFMLLSAHFYPIPSLFLDLKKFIYISF